MHSDVCFEGREQTGFGFSYVQLNLRFRKKKAKKKEKKLIFDKVSLKDAHGSKHLFLASVSALLLFL